MPRTKKLESRFVVAKPVKKAALAKIPKKEIVKVKEEAAKPKKVVTELGSIVLKGKDAELVKKYQRKKDDTGSTEVQVALFTAKINSLSKHLKKHSKDSDSKRGLLIMVGKRRRLLNYLKKTDIKQYEKIIVDLGLRK